MGAESVREENSPPQMAASDQPIMVPTNNLDWVKKEDMTAEQQASVAKFCCGAYIEPQRDYEDADKHPDQSPFE